MSQGAMSGKYKGIVSVTVIIILAKSLRTSSEVLSDVFVGLLNSKEEDVVATIPL